MVGDPYLLSLCLFLSSSMGGLVGPPAHWSIGEIDGLLVIIKVFNNFTSITPIMPEKMGH